MMRVMWPIVSDDARAAIESARIVLTARDVSTRRLYVFGPFPADRVPPLRVRALCTWTLPTELVAVPTP